MKFILGFLVGGLSYAFMAADPPIVHKQVPCETKRQEQP
jgi:hypothetical protein